MLCHLILYHLSATRESYEQRVNDELLKDRVASNLQSESAGIVLLSN